MYIVRHDKTYKNVIRLDYISSADNVIPFNVQLMDSKRTSVSLPQGKENVIELKHKPVID